jgi:Tfp pilus assembly protein PilX
MTNYLFQHRPRRDERGQALVIVLAAFAVGTLAIAPFMGLAGTTMLGAGVYTEVINQRYACDAGAEHALWNLVWGTLASLIPNPGNSTSYNLAESLNGVTPRVTATYLSLTAGDKNYRVAVTAGGRSVTVLATIRGTSIYVTSWQMT